MIDLDNRLKQNTDFFLKIGTEYFRPVVVEPYQLKVGGYVFTRAEGLSFPTIVRITSTDGSYLVGRSVRTSSDYNFTPSSVICTFELIKPYGVYRVENNKKIKTIFASCSFQECCEVQEKWQEVTDRKVAVFYVATI